MRVRISCASLASIKINNGYLLCLNKSSLKAGRKVYTPIGGALEYSPEALPFLKNIESEFERKSPDLRLFIDDSNTELFEIWFNKKVQREIGIDRELIEEMVLEEGVFDTLTKNDFTTTYLRCVKDDANYNNILNHRYFEIYKVTFKPNRIDQILSVIKGGSNLRIVSAEEIMKSRTVDGIEIGQNAKSIIN